MFEFVPIWGIKVYLKYAMRRVLCLYGKCVVVEKVPWSACKNHLTHHYARNSFFTEMSKVQENFSTQIKVICSDMWKPYMKVIAKHIP